MIITLNMKMIALVFMYVCYAVEPSSFSKLEIYVCVRPFYLGRVCASLSIQLFFSPMKRGPNEQAWLNAVTHRKISQHVADL